jgi:hypothetical protein
VCKGAEEEVSFVGRELSKVHVVVKLAVVQELDPASPPHFTFGSGSGGNSDVS